MLKLENELGVGNFASLECLNVCDFGVGKLKQKCGFNLHDGRINSPRVSGDRVDIVDEMTETPGTLKTQREQNDSLTHKNLYDSLTFLLQIE